MFSLTVESSERTQEPNASGSQNTELLEFSVGNHKVEHVTGVIHLYKKTSGSKEHSEGTSKICVLGVPPDVGVQEFCRLCDAYLHLIKEMRFLRRENTRERSYMVYLQFNDKSSAAGFFEEHDGHPFCSFEESVIWKMIFVDSLEFSTEPKPTIGETELPTCPVCLERLDENASGVVMTVCNHLFHNACLMKWEDTSCPVCRHCMQGSPMSSCSVCGVSEDVWICLICGHVGCGRYKSKHAYDHWEHTQHCYALELDSQRVWDYVGDGYVHRLVQSKSGGNLVEVPSLGECSGARSSQQSEGECTKVDYDRDEAIVASKIDAVAFEYNHLLSAQLESQRLYFEAMLIQNRLDNEAKLASMTERMSESTKVFERSVADAKEVAKQKKATTRKVSELTDRVDKVEEEKEFLRQLNETLIANQKEWKRKTESLEKQLKDQESSKGSRINELEEQVRDLIVFIEAQKEVKEEGELEGGSLVVHESHQQEREARQTRRRRSRR